MRRLTTSASADRSALAEVAFVVGLYLLALAIRLLAATQVPFPATEPSAYYAAVAENVVAGRGLVSDAIWSYATPPLVVPKPAFDLWLPMSSLVSAAGMAVLGSSFWAAQVGGAIIGALVAPLAWAIGRGAAREAGLDRRRGRAVAAASGVLAAILGPLVLASVVPDSHTPYLVFVLVAALLIPTALGAREDLTRASAARDRPVIGLLLGVSMGLAYLSRQEIVWLGLTFVLMLAWVLRSRQDDGRVREGAARLWPVVVGGLVVVLPWLARNSVDLGSPFPGQAIENMLFTRNEDVFAYLERPSLGRYLEQGLVTVLLNPLAGAWHGFVDVLAVPAFPVGLAGLASLGGLRRSGALRRPTALQALLISGGLTFVGTALFFPVATRWGTFLHASGPLVVALIVLAALGADALMARVSELRHWRAPNIILGPVALVVVTALLGTLQLSLVAKQSQEQQKRFGEVASALQVVAAQDEEELPATLISDHPMWLAEALDRHVVALPDEEVASIMALGRHFDAPWVVVLDERGRYPGALLEPAAAACFTDDPLRIPLANGPAWLFRMAQRCDAA